MSTAADREERQDGSQHAEESLEFTVEDHEGTFGRENNGESRRPTLIEIRPSGRFRRSPSPMEIPRPTRSGSSGRSASSGSSSRRGSSRSRHRSQPSGISAAAFIDEDAVNPFECDLFTTSFASLADDGEKDFYKPLPVADQMGHFARLPPTFNDDLPLELSIERLGTLVMGYDDDENDDFDVEAQAQHLKIQEMIASLGSDKEVDIDIIMDSEKSETSEDSVEANTETIFRTKTREEDDCTRDPYRRETAVGERNNIQHNAKRIKSRSVLTAGLESLKYLYSLVLLVFCVVLVTGAIFTNQTASTANGFSPIVAFCVFWFLILWLAMMEGGQGALVGLQPIDRSRYKESHPRTYINTGLTANGSDGLERFIIGRQFLVVLVVFVSQLVSSTIPNIYLWGLGDTVKAIFLDSGLALMVVTIVLGQLLAQLNAAKCMLDFVNNYFMLYFVTYLSLLIEFSGLLHSVYLVQMLFSKIGGGSGKGSSSRTVVQILFFWARVLFSLAVLGLAFAVTLSALFRGKTTMWKSVPEAISVVLFFGLMCFVGMMEGMQIAFFAVLNYPEEQLAQYRIAQKNCKLTFRGENLQSFLIGRQICVTICTFIIARITTLDVKVGTDENIFGVSDGLQTFFNTGLLGAVITTIVSSLAWRIIASSFPLAFLSNPLVNIIIRICLVFEASGICSSAWVLARFHKIIARYRTDEVYLENAEPNASTTISTRDKDIDRFSTVLRFTISLALFLFSVILISASIFTGQTRIIAGNDDWRYSLLVYVVFWFLIIWLAMTEGSLGCLMGLKTVDKFMYMVSHQNTYENTEIVHKGDNLQRFIVGRQFLVLAVIFVCTWLTEPVVDASVLGLPEIVNKIFLSSDIAFIVILIIAGQLTSEVNAAKCMLDFVNNCFVLYFVTYLSLAIEYSGLLHSVYFFQIALSKISGKKIESEEPERSILQKIFFWGRIICSILVLGFSIVVTVVSLVYGEATLLWGLSDASFFTIIIVLMCVVGMMEGVQIALFGMSNISERDLASHKMAYRNYKLACSEQNLQAFLIGRQICVTCFFVLIARMSTLSIDISVDDNVFGVPDGVQMFFNSGVPAALVTTILASLVWRLFASSFPVTFMSNPMIYGIIWLCLIVDASGICSACWMFGRWTKRVLGYQPDPVYLEDAPKEGPKPVTRRDKDVDVTSTVIRYILSSALLCIAIYVTVSLIFMKQTELSSKTNPWFVLILFGFLLAYLGTMEGGQGCLVGLQRVENYKYEDTHRVALKNTKISHDGNNMQRFIVGRQFLVVLVVFVVNLCGSPLPHSEVFGLPDSMMAIFVDSGVSLILITVILGQLPAQVNAASCMLDFINSYFMLYFVTYVSMAIELSGLLHCVYLVQMVFSNISGTEIQTNEPPRTTIQALFFFGRVVLSLAMLAFAFAVTLTAMFGGKTTSWESVPSFVSVIIFFVLMCIAGMMEGMQIALFAVVNLPKEEVAQYKMAKASCQLAFRGNNLQAFLIGRQIFVTLCTFVIARLTTLDVKVGSGENIFGVPDTLQEFLNTGLLGAVITTVVGSLAWRIIAASFPVAFLSNPLVYLILRLCLVLEASGVCSVAWLVALINKQMFGYQPDNLYLNSSKSRKEEDIVDPDKYATQQSLEIEATDSLEQMESQEIDL